MLSKPMQTSLNKQIQAEYTAFYLYLSMQAFYHRQNLDGFAAWMAAQSAEEAGHAQRLFDYVLERNGEVVLHELGAPQKDWKSPLDAVKAALAHEKRVTTMINKLFKQAIAEDDHATRIFLHWFVTEQVEEEANVDRIVQRMKLGDGSPAVLLMIDRELGQRSSES